MWLVDAKMLSVVFGLRLKRFRKLRSEYLRGCVPLVVGLGAVAIACLPLLNMRSIFYNDWINHLWTIQYFGEYFKQNSYFPHFVNTSQVAGMPFPLFYAEKFYIASGALSTVFGAAVTIRILVALVLLIQFIEVFTTLSTVSGPIFCLFVSTCAIWQTYVLSDLYNRSALTEFFALSMLCCALMVVWRIIIKSSSSRLDIFLWTKIFIYYSIASCTHPLTALFGGILLALIAASASVFLRGRSLAVYLGGGCLCAALSLSALAPWIYINFLYHDVLPMTGAAGLKYSFQDAGFFPGSIDSLISRLWPIPADARVLNGNITAVSTPYIDPQVSMPLALTLIVLLILAVRSGQLQRDVRNNLRVGLALVSIIAASGAFVVSIHPSLSAHVGGFFDVLQFPYRLTAYVNLAILSAIVALADRWPPRIWSSVLLFANATLLVAGVSLKLNHAFAIRTLASENRVFDLSRPRWKIGADQDRAANWVPSPIGTSKNLAQLPTTYYGTGPYTVLQGFGIVPVVRDFLHTTFLAIPVHVAPEFGTTFARSIVLDSSMLVVTNVQPFPWNQIIVDGHLVPQVDSLIGTSTDEYGYPGIAVHLESGAHQFELVSKVPKTWNLLNNISWIVIVAGLFTCLTLGQAPSWRARRL